MIFAMGWPLPGQNGCGSVHFVVTSSVLEASVKTPWLQSQALIVVLALASVILGMVPVIHYVFVPFDFFTTFIHEGSHAVASLLMGENVAGIVINPDTSGYMQHTVSGGRFAQGFIASAGYIGAAIFGGLMIVGSARPKLTRSILLILGGIFVIAAVLYVRDIFTLLITAGWAATLIFLGLRASETMAFFSVNFLAVQCGLNSFHDVFTLVRLSLGAEKSPYSLGHSDADTVAQLFWLPSIVWSVLWVGLSGLILLTAIKKSMVLRSRSVA